MSIKELKDSKRKTVGYIRDYCSGGVICEILNDKRTTIGYLRG